MSVKLHLVMPMAGRGSRFNGQGFELPKPLIKIYGKPFYFWAVRSVSKFVELASLDFVVLQEHVDCYGIDKAILSDFPEAQIHILPDVTEGAVITGLKGIEEIDDTLPVVFNDCDHLFKSSKFNAFCKDKFSRTVEGILLTFQSNEAKYSFVGKDDAGNVIRTVEKEVISTEAICGCYYFRNVDSFRQAAGKYLKQCNYNEYFMSGVYNVMIEDKKIVKSMETDFHVPFGIPEEYGEAQKSKCYEELL